MSAIYDKAFAAYRALCELEDELDRPLATTSERERNELRSLQQRWSNDTDRKIERTLGRKPT